MKTFFDTNVLLETILEGRKKSHVAGIVLSRAEHSYISPLTAHLYVYFAKKEGHAVNELLKDLQSYQLTDMNSPAVQWAIKNRKNDDFEDALQIACAVLDGCDIFVTFDKNLYRDYKDLPTIEIRLLK